MADSAGVAKRMREARFRTAAERGDSVSQAAMAQLVSTLTTRVVHQTQWGRYETGESEPPLEVIIATAKVSGLSEVYIAFGTTSPEPREAKLERPDVPAPRDGERQAPGEERKGA